MSFGGNVFEPEIPVEVAEEAAKRATGDAEAKAQAKAEVKAVEPGAWTAFESLGSHIEQAGAPYQAAEYRIEDKGSVRLRGTLKVAAGKELSETETLAIIKTGFRPPATVMLNTSPNTAPSVALFFVAATGAITLATSTKVKAGELIFLDDHTFNIT